MTREKFNAAERKIRANIASKAYYNKNLEQLRKTAREKKALKRRENPEIILKLREQCRRTRLKVATEIDILLGNICVCCGNTKDLQIDHKVGSETFKYFRRGGSTLIKELRKNPGNFQRLCRDCNRWKSNGPCCPCQWWDAQFPDWKEQAKFRQEKLRLQNV